jgi:RNA polymerase sigma-70 factor (ECF subfamily)
VPADREQRFAAFVEAKREQAVRLAWRLLGGDMAAAEDVTQEAFLRAYRGLDGFRGESALSTWFYRILVREVQRYRRWRAVRERFAAEPQGELGGPPEPLPDPALQDRIAQALEKLSRGQRETFVLVHLEGFTVVQTAELLGRSAGTIKSHLHRALKTLRSELADVREEEKHHDLVKA